ncbi:hypothetical protein GCM10010372_02800 [Streptomyces tauricus]|nr:hypothetical protein GCM10010372_02800 [Streptomyces tauricus]
MLVLFLDDVTREFGTALGVTLLGAVLTAGCRSAIDSRLAGAPEADADRAREGVTNAPTAADGADQHGRALVRAAQESFDGGWQQAMWAGAAVSTRPAPGPPHPPPAPTATPTASSYGHGARCPHGATAFMGRPAGGPDRGCVVEGGREGDVVQCGQPQQVPDARLVADQPNTAVAGTGTTVGAAEQVQSAGVHEGHRPQIDDDVRSGLRGRGVEIAADLADGEDVDLSVEFDHRGLAARKATSMGAGQLCTGQRVGIVQRHEGLTRNVVRASVHCGTAMRRPR